MDIYNLLVGVLRSLLVITTDSQLLPYKVCLMYGCQIDALLLCSYEPPDKIDTTESFLSFPNAKH